MNEFRLKSSGQVVSDIEYRALHPNTAFPAVLAPLDADPILAAPAPVVSATQIASRNGVVQDNMGNWVHAWIVTTLPQAQLDAALLDAKQRLILKIDADVDDIYEDTLGGRASEYALAEQDALAYKTAGYTGTVPASVSSWATAKGQTNTWSADSIIATASAWRSAQSSIRSNRLIKKEAARSAASMAAYDTVNAQWSGFVSSIRQALGL